MTIQFILITPTLRFYFLMKDLWICALLCCRLKFSTPHLPLNGGVKLQTLKEPQSAHAFLGGKISPSGVSIPPSASPVCTLATKALQRPPSGSLQLVYICMLWIWRENWPRLLAGKRSPLGLWFALCLHVHRVYYIFNLDQVEQFIVLKTAWLSSELIFTRASFSFVKFYR
jgi:hypothetical protein